MFIKVRVQSVIQNEIVYKTLFFNEHFIKSIVVDEDKNKKAKTVTILYDERGNNNLVDYEIHLLKKDDKIRCYLILANRSIASVFWLGGDIYETVPFTCTKY